MVMSHVEEAGLQDRKTETSTWRGADVRNIRKVSSGGLSVLGLRHSEANFIPACPVVWWT